MRELTKERIITKYDNVYLTRLKIVHLCKSYYSMRLLKDLLFLACKGEDSFYAVIKSYPKLWERDE